MFWEITYHDGDNISLAVGNGFINQRRILGHSGCLEDQRWIRRSILRLHTLDGVNIASVRDDDGELLELFELGCHVVAVCCLFGLLQRSKKFLDYEGRLLFRCCQMRTVKKKGKLREKRSMSSYLSTDWLGKIQEWGERRESCWVQAYEELERSHDYNSYLGIRGVEMTVLQVHWVRRTDG